jgi:choline dehydrogenase-like flavoprotein
MPLPKTQSPKCLHPYHILIIGGGLAGLASALALKQSGHYVTILERMTELQQVQYQFSHYTVINQTLILTAALKDWGRHSTLSQCHLRPTCLWNPRRGRQARFSACLGQSTQLVQWGISISLIAAILIDRGDSQSTLPRGSSRRPFGDLILCRHGLRCHCTAWLRRRGA